MKQFSSLILISLVWSVNAQTEFVQFIKEGDDSFSSKNYQAALELYEKAAKDDKKNMEAVFKKGLAKIELKDLDGALNDFTTVIRKLPGHYGALMNRGNVYALKEEFSMALRDYYDALEANPNGSGIYVNRGMTYSKMNQFKLAIADFSKAIELNSDNVKAYRYRSEAYNNTGQMQLAQKDLESILLIDSSDIWAQNNLAFCYVSAKRFEEAGRLYERLFELDSLSPYVLNNFGYVKHMLGNSSEGLNMINRSLQLMPGNSYAYKYLAEIYLSLNDIVKTCASIDKGIELGYTRTYGNELLELKTKYCQ